METLDIASKTLMQDFVCDGNDALNFKLVRMESDIRDDSTSFKPEMVHQIYGENENIFGYRGLKVDFWMTAGSLKCYLNQTADETINPKKAEGVLPDEVIPPLVKLLAPGQALSSLSEFLKAVKKDEEFTPIGNKLSSFTLDGSDKVVRNYEIYEADESIKGFREYHAKLQPWIMFYIDAASYIDIDDENWKFYLLFERTNINGSPRYYIAGYMTIYKYYAYPDKIRPRISQMLILPPYQKQGLGAKLLDIVSKTFWDDSNVVDITVEDPSDDFIRLRDFVDVTNALSLDCFSSQIIKKGFSSSMVQESGKKLKLCKKQVRRVYEIIRFLRTNISNPQEYKDYRVDVKKRLNQPYQKEERQLAKLQKVLKPEEYTAATINITNRQQRLENLHSLYSELEEHYRAIVTRVEQRQ
ncbi:histone acetyltransferase type B catalytic subunit isoform X1 [Lepeophtheirus salmonis]|uniref:histone acetyltransferase type B catalytic subunit isoform X1 n=1 Tax=Lepeophtheirus salmonis TaxID=72036 RepID=UPI001AEB438C|nr:histone acetyltransferase type B catalytic subunit-like isoform X1 [Lepeophtheirus salmonis]